MTKSHHSFNAPEDLSNFIDELAKKYNSKNEMFVEIFTKFMKGEIEDINEVAEKILQVKLSILKKKNQKVSIDYSVAEAKIENLNADTNLKKAIIDHYKRNNQSKTLPNHLKILEGKIESNDYDKNPKENQGLRCVECGVMFLCDIENIEERSEAVEIYCNHIFKKHRKELLDEEIVYLEQFIRGIEIAN